MGNFRKYLGYFLSLNLLWMFSPTACAQDSLVLKPQESVPALLLFAQQQNIKPSAELKNGKGVARELEVRLGNPPTISPAKPAVAPSVVKARIGSLEQRLQEQTKIIKDLRLALTKAQSRTSPQVVPQQPVKKLGTVAPSVAPQVIANAEPVVIDIHPLAAAWVALRQAIRPDPSLEQLQARLDIKEKTLGEQQRVTAGLYRQLADEQQQQQHDALALVTQMEKVAELQRENRSLQSQIRQQPESLALDAEVEKQSYAAGVALGREILDLQQKNQQAGLVTDQQRLLAGITDSFTGSIKLSDSVLQQTLLKLQTAGSPLLDTRPAAGPVKLVELIDKSSDNGGQDSTTQGDGERFMAEFSQDKAVKKDALGFYYRIDYLGNGAINTQDHVELVVTESLSNGTVIKDMESAGTVISQKLADYPPLFQAAIKHLEQHGSLTMVVPPALAYGAKGNPPGIPANSTMVYVLRISNVVPVASVQ